MLRGILMIRYSTNKSIFKIFLLNIDLIFQEVGYDSPRGGVSVVIEKGKWTTSHLLIQRATSKDSGIYKCAPLNAISATINLHVLRGKNPDAWQTSGSIRLWNPNFNNNSWTNN